MNERTALEYLNANIVLIGEMLTKLTNETDRGKLSAIYYNADGVLMSLGFAPEYIMGKTQDTKWAEIEEHIRRIQ